MSSNGPDEVFSSLHISVEACGHVEDPCCPPGHDLVVVNDGPHRLHRAVVGRRYVERPHRLVAVDQVSPLHPVRRVVVLRPVAAAGVVGHHGELGSGCCGRGTGHLPRLVVEERAAVAVDWRRRRGVDVEVVQAMVAAEEVVVRSARASLEFVALVRGGVLLRQLRVLVVRLGAQRRRWQVNPRAGNHCKYETNICNNRETADCLTVATAIFLCLIHHHKDVPASVYQIFFQHPTAEHVGGD